MLIVTGATGQLGRAIVHNLLTRFPADRIGASVRDLSKAADLVSLGVRVREGDFSQPDSLQHAFEGASQLLIVSSNAGASGGDPVQQHRAAIDAAKAVGAARVIYTSHMAASAVSAFPPMRDHVATEAILQQSGLAWTALRHGFYAASAITIMRDAFETGTLETPADGKFSWTAHADLAEAAAIILAGNGQFDGPTPPLTGPQSLDFSDLAEIASTLQSKSVHRVILTYADMRTRIAARGAAPRGVDALMGLFIASRNGEFARVDPALARLLGRPPVKVSAVISNEIAVLGNKT